MKKLTIYAIVFARFIIILIGLVPAAIFFLFTVLGAIGEIYLSNLFAFITSTKTQIAAFETELSKKA